MATLLAILSALPKILALIQLIGGMVRDAEQRGLGRKEAVAEALTIATSQIETANKVEAEAMQSHAKDNTDDAFDRSFERKEP
jgi:hypothetical protein